MTQPPDAPRPDTGPKPRTDARPVFGSFLGMGGMACVLFLVLASGLVAPWYGVALLTLVWLVLFVVGIRWFMRHPWRVAALPLVMVVVWFSTVTAGAAFLDWNA